MMLWTRKVIAVLTEGAPDVLPQALDDCGGLTDPRLWGGGMPCLTLCFLGLETGPLRLLSFMDALESAPTRVSKYATFAATHKSKRPERVL